MLPASERHRLERLVALGGAPPAIVCDVGFTNGLSAIRALVALGVRVVAIDHRPNALGFSARGATGVVAPSPTEDPDGYAETIAGVADALRTHCVGFATHDAPLAILTRVAAERTSLLLPGPGLEALAALQRKETQLEAARRAGVPIPGTVRVTSADQAEEIRAALTFPLVVKPENGLLFKAAIGRQLIDVEEPGGLDQALALAFATGEKALLVQEVVAGGDDALWTVGSFTDHAGELRGVFCGRKLAQMPPRFGTARVAEARFDPEPIRLATRLLTELEYRGIAQTELKRDVRDGSYRLMEVNPRLWQWHSLARRCGVDLVGMAYRDAIGGDPGRAASSPRDDGRRWVPTVAHWRSAREHGESRREALRPLLGLVEEPILSLRDPLPGLKTLVGAALGPVRSRLGRRRR